MPNLPADPTPQQVLSYRAFSGGRISIAWSGLRRLLLDVLPAAIELANETEGLSLPVPKTATIAPELVGEDFPTWVISSSVDLPLWGSNSEMQANTLIYLGYNQMLSKNDIKDSHDLLELVNAMLYPFRGGHAENGMQLWDQLVPGPRTFVAGLPNWENARGFAQHYDLQQFPGQTRWVPVTP